MTVKRSRATKRFTPDAIEQAVMDAATQLIVDGHPAQEAQTVMIAGFLTAEVLRGLAAPELTVLTVVSTPVLT